MERMWNVLRDLFGEFCCSVLRLGVVRVETLVSNQIRSNIFSMSHLSQLAVFFFFVEKKLKLYEMN